MGETLTKKRKRLKQQLDKHEKYMKQLDYYRKNLVFLNPAIFDIEATGFKKEDEILQFSMIDLSGNVLFDKLFKPKNLTSWEDSIEIHGISYEDVKNRKSFSYYKREIEKLLKKHKLIIGYSIELDIILLKKYDIDISNNIFLDISYLGMLIFMNKKNSPKLCPSLKALSLEYGYDFDAHNALNDCYATLYCLKSLLVEDKSNFEYKYDKELLNVPINDIPKNSSKLYNLAKIYVDLYESNNNKVVLDLETTGIRENDEIIQLSIINLEGKILFNQYIKPTKVENWDEAYKIHKISKELLEDKNNIEVHRKNIQKILDNVKYIIGYGVAFDYKLLKRNNFDVDHIKTLDISEFFKYLYRKILNDPKVGRPKLIECSSFYGFKENGFHNSLIDTKATLLAYKGIYKDMKDVLNGKFEC